MNTHQPAVVEVLRARFGEPGSLRFMEAWGPRVVAEAVVAESVLFVKAAGDADVRAEEAALGMAEAAGVPVPELLDSGVHPELPGGYWIVTRRARGEPWRLTEGENGLQLAATTERTLQDIGAAFGRLHNIRVEGFGPISSGGAGTFGSWPDWLQHDAEQSVRQLARAGVVGKEFRARIADAFARRSPSISQGSLIHGDLGNSETFLDPRNGALTGMVDWGGAVGGDPIYEFARFNAGGPADDPRPRALLPGLVRHYRAITGTEQERFDETLPLYHVHNAIQNAAWSHREGVPWVPDLLAKAEKLLRQLGA